MNQNLSNFQCPICQMIYNNPLKITQCSHTFCKKCIKELINTQKDNKCPICRVTFYDNELLSDDEMKNKINFEQYTCQCGKTFPLSYYNTHYDECNVIKNQNEEIVKNNLFKNAKPSVNRVTFNCTLCSEGNFDRKGYIEHINKKHPNARGVCAICKCQPWGDPNYKTHIKGHLELRHQFDYDTTVDYNNDEDAVLQQVLLESMKDY